MHPVRNYNISKLQKLQKSTNLVVLVFYYSRAEVPNRVAANNCTLMNFWFNFGQGVPPNGKYWNCPLRVPRGKKRVEKHCSRGFYLRLANSIIDIIFPSNFFRFSIHFSEALKKLLVVDFKIKNLDLYLKGSVID